jgi:hypothetical protein
MERAPKLPLAAALENAYNYPPGSFLDSRRIRVNNANTRKLLANAKKLSGTKRKRNNQFGNNNTRGTKRPKINESLFNKPNNTSKITAKVLIDTFKDITSKFPKGTRYGIKYHTNNNDKATYSTQIAPNHFPFILIRLPRKWKPAMDKYRPGFAVNNGM